MSMSLCTYVDSMCLVCEWIREWGVCVCVVFSLHRYEWISNGWQWHIVCLFCRQRLSCSRLWSGWCNGTWTFSNLNWYMHFIFGIICCDHFLNINKTNARISHGSQPNVRRVHEHMNKMIYFIWSHSSFHLEIMQNPLEKQRRTAIREKPSTNGDSIDRVKLISIVCTQPNILSILCVLCEN